MGGQNERTRTRTSPDGAITFTFRKLSPIDLIDVEEAWPSLGLVPSDVIRAQGAAAAKGEPDMVKALLRGQAEWIKRASLDPVFVDDRAEEYGENEAPLSDLGVTNFHWAYGEVLAFSMGYDSAEAMREGEKSTARFPAESTGESADSGGDEVRSSAE